MSIVLQTLRNAAGARWASHALGLAAFFVFMLLQGFSAHVGWIIVRNTLLGFVVVDLVWVLTDLGRRRLKKLGAAHYDFSGMDIQDQSWAQGKLLALPGAESRRLAAAWLIAVGLGFVFHMRRAGGGIQSVEPLPFVAILGTGMAAALVAQRLMLRRHQRRLLASFPRFSVDVDGLQRARHGMLPISFTGEMGLLAGYWLLFPVLAWLAQRVPQAAAFAWHCLVGAAMTFWMTRLWRETLARPLEDLELAMRRFENGDADAGVELVSGDALGRVQQAWNRVSAAMGRALLQARDFGGMIPAAKRDALVALEIPAKGMLRELALLEVRLLGLETVTPDKSLHVANGFQSLVIDRLDANEGALESFDSQRARAMFNAPLDLQDYALKAAICAVELQRGLEAWVNVQRMQHGANLEYCLMLAAGKGRLAYLGVPGRRRLALMGGLAAQTDAMAGLAAGQVLLDQALSQVLQGRQGWDLQAIQTQEGTVYKVNSAPQGEAAPPADLGFTPGDRLPGGAA